MYRIRTEYQFASRWYRADSYTDAMELFNLLNKSCRFVQVWHGDKLTAEYKN